jgi:glycosyltransferase involved in cell wall biosynthesis
MEKINKKVGILVLGDESSGGVFQYTKSMIDALVGCQANEYIIFCNKKIEAFDSYNFELRKLYLPELNIIKKVIRFIQLLFSIRRPFFFKSKELQLFEDIDIFLLPKNGLYPHYYLNKPYIMTLHDMQERYFSEYFTKFELAMRYIIRKKLTKYARKVICESNYVKNDIIRFLGISESKIKVVESPPPKTLLSFVKNDKISDAVKIKYKLPQKYIYYPAQFWYHKNHIKLLEAFAIANKQFKDLHLLLTGNKDNNYHNIINKIKTLNLEDSVKYLGYVDYEDIPYLYILSEFLIMPSLFESISLPIYEAFALKVPVCCSNVVALPEQVGNAALLFDPYDKNDIANNIIKYLKDEKLMKINGQLGYDRISNYNHTIYKEKISNVI